MNAPEPITITPKQQFLATNLKAGEEYAGILLGENGEPDVHLILLPGDNDDADWQTQMDWAKNLGGELPTRREQSLLFANLKSKFQARAYWSAESYDDKSAWCQGFDYGTQGDVRKGNRLRARAVRRLVIE